MFSYLFVFFVWISLLFTVGHLVTRFLANVRGGDFYSAVLRNVFAGYVSIIVVLSLFYTGFKTINIVLLLIGALICYESRKKRIVLAPTSSVFAFRQILTIAVVAITFVLITRMTISNSESSVHFFYRHIDYILYGGISKLLPVNGQENGFGILNSLDQYYNNPEPYHFFDLWGATVVSRIFSVNAFPALVVIIYPTFYLLCFAGYMSLLRRDDLSGILLAIAFCCVGGFAFPFFEIHPIISKLTVLSHNLLNPWLYKLSYFYVFLISGFLLYRSGYVTISVLICLGLPVANIISFPTLIPSLVIFLAISYFISQTDRKELIRSSAYVIFVAVAILLFYFLNKRKSAGLAGVEISKPSDLIKGILDTVNLVTQRNLIIGTGLLLLALYSPYIAVMGLNWKRFKRTTLGLFPIIVAGVSLLVLAVLYYEMNSLQLVSNTTIVLINVAVVIILAEVANSHLRETGTKTSLLISSALVGISIAIQITFNVMGVNTLRTTLHDDNYLKSVEATVAPNSLIGSIKSVEEMTPIFGKYNAVYPLGGYLLLQSKNCFAVNISDLSTPIDSTSAISLSRNLKAIRDGIFYRYSKIPENAHLNEEELMAKFVKQYGIRYLVVQKGAKLPALFENRAKSILVDPMSGERFVELSN